jgi:hypothetical protein
MGTMGQCQWALGVRTCNLVYIHPITKDNIGYKMTWLYLALNFNGHIIYIFALPHERLYIIYEHIFIYTISFTFDIFHTRYQSLYYEFLDIVGDC